MDSLDRPKQINEKEIWHMEFKEFQQTASPITIARDTPNYKIDVMAVQEVREDSSGIKPEGDYTFFFRNWNQTHELWKGFLARNRIISEVKRAQIACDV